MRRLAADDAGLWRRAMRDVAPLPGRGVTLLGRDLPDRGRSGRPHPNPPALAGEGAEAGETPAVQAPVPYRPPPPAKPQPPLDRFAGVDRATAERLKRGRYQVEARLDLHGMTQAEAHRALSGFIGWSRGAGRRCVLVITGHGRMTGGVLKSAVPRWLSEPGLRSDVLAITPAQPRAGGDGALYVLLRRLPQ
jgi:DNA-nicking Smr family endonuclease